jgi:hypothetical protein
VWLPAAFEAVVLLGVGVKKDPVRGLEGKEAGNEIHYWWESNPPQPSNLPTQIFEYDILKVSIGAWLVRDQTRVLQIFTPYSPLPCLHGGLILCCKGTHMDSA